jgi:2-dehydro-3-deoxyphosphooctonate aldolase (KDO 8-P synthase)
MSKKVVEVGGIQCGGDQLFLIAGPCVIEHEKTMFTTAERVKKISEKLNIPFIFKSSFQKDNRSSLDYYSGPGIKDGLDILQSIKDKFKVPVVSDVHYPQQVEEAVEILDLIQIPAYMCMQTELVVKAALTKKPVNLKHGQFLAPENMIKPIKKIEQSGSRDILLTERGYTFGYNDLVVDPRSFYHLNKTGYPVVFDITHSIRRYGIPSADPSGGHREYMPTIARAGVAAGVDGVFIEVHPEPQKALCDASSQMSVENLEDFLLPLLEIHSVVRKCRDRSF